MAVSSRLIMNRTEEQATANTFDCDLYRLISRAEYETDKEKGNRHPLKRAEWREVVYSLKVARAAVRLLMHPNDRKGTEG